MIKNYVHTTIGLHYTCGNFMSKTLLKDAMPVSVRSELITSNILTIFKQ